MHQCLCCLKGDPDKNLTTPYTHLGKTEIYSDMLKECFDLQLTPGTNGECGICEVCVGRLRDASDFKQQVQRSQAELRTQGAHVKKEKRDADGNFESVVMCEVQINMKEEPEDGEMFADHDASDGLAMESEETQDKTTEDPASNQPSDGPPPPEPEFIPVPVPETIFDRPSLLSAPAPAPAPAPQTRRPPRPPLVHVSDITPYECGTCGAKFTQLLLLSQHVSAAHKKEPKPKRCRHVPPKVRKPRVRKPREKPKPKPADNPNGELFTCEACGKNFAARNGLNAHMRTHSERKSFTCEICNKEFRFLNNFQTHLKMHTAKKVFPCEICKKEFKFLCHFQAHKRKHKDEKPFPCDVCSKPFNKLTQMIRHKLTTHKGERRHSCEVCNLVFSSANNLKAHKRVRYYTSTTSSEN